MGYLKQYFPQKKHFSFSVISYTSLLNQCNFWSSFVPKFKILFLKQSFNFQAVFKTNNAVVVLNRWADIFISVSGIKLMHETIVLRKTFNKRRLIN